MTGDDGNELCKLWKLFKTLYLNGAKIQTFVYKQFPKINVMMSGSDLKKTTYKIKQNKTLVKYKIIV